MSIAKVLVPVTGAKRDAIALETAFKAARPFHAHVEVLFAHPDPREALPFLGVPLNPDVTQTIINGQEQITAAAAKAARDMVAEIAEGAGAKMLNAADKSDVLTYSFRQVSGRLPAACVAAACLSDLVVFVPKPEFVDVAEAFLNVLTQAQRPVLLASKVPDGTFARHVAIGWDGGAAAAHALTAALPYLRRAETIELLCAEPLPQSALSAQDAQAYLALRGLACGTRVFACGGKPVGQALAEAAVKAGTDLLVIGGYSHSHLRETIFGGVTSHILSHATMPIFLMH